MSLQLMGRKRGMTQIFDEGGVLSACTLVVLEKHVVVQLKTQQKDGYQGVQLGTDPLPPSKKRKLTKPLTGHFKSAQVKPMSTLAESRVPNVDAYQVGQEIGVEYFQEGEYLDVCGRSKGKGFQGVMKRHNFGGGPASHGSKFHRAAGSTGMRSTPGRCLPQTKKPGRMGGDWVTVEGLLVLKINVDKAFLILRGCVPGMIGGLLYCRKSVKRIGGCGSCPH